MPATATPTKRLSQADVRRLFVAKYLDSKVKKSGAVDGFDEWWAKATPFARQQMMRYAEAAGLKYERDGRTAEDVLHAGTSALHEQLRLYRPKDNTPVKAEEVKALVELLVRTLSWRDPPKLIVDQVVEDQPRIYYDYAKAADERYFDRTRPPAPRPATISPKPAPTPTPAVDRPPLRRT